MRVNTYGDFNNPKIVIINPIMSDERISKVILSKLSKEYYVTELILSGFYPNSTYSSMQKEELEMSIYFKSHNLNKIDIMIGLSIGGNIAFDFYTKNTDLINKLVIDSAPIFKYSFIRRKWLCYKYRKMIIKILKNRNKVSEILKKENDILKYQKNIILLINEKSLENIINDNYRMNLHNLSKNQQEKITFVYGTKDKARYAMIRLKKYKYINYMTIKNAGHCQFFMKKTNSYIKNIIKR